MCENGQKNFQKKITTLHILSRTEGSEKMKRKILPGKFYGVFTVGFKKIKENFLWNPVDILFYIFFNHSKALVSI
jgi:hypothetical protein